MTSQQSLFEILGAGFAIYLVIEGVMPFLSPTAFKRAMQSVIQIQDSNLRVFGLVSMLAGVALLYLINR